jgi:NAD(P)-dependent dehydrogenase (short-subunit alcohol dehydrogenase family)
MLGQAVAHRMVAQGQGGSIVFVTSQLAQVAVREKSAYLVSKGGLRSLTMGMALDLAPHGIRVNAVAPGPVLFWRATNRDGSSAPPSSSTAAILRNEAGDAPRAQHNKLAHRHVACLALPQRTSQLRSGSRNPSPHSSPFLALNPACFICSIDRTFACKQNLTF